MNEAPKLTDYIAVTRTGLSGLPWQYEFQAFSDIDAMNKAEGWTKEFTGVRWFMALDVYRKAEPLKDSKLVFTCRVRQYADVDTEDHDIKI